MKKRLLSALAVLMLLATAALAGTTTHYGWVTPTVGASQNTWGSTLNTAVNAIDTNLWAVSGGRNTAVNAPAASASNITLTNPLSSTQNISFSGDNLNLILPPMNVSQGLVPGGFLYVNNVGSHTFSILAQDGSTSVVASVTAGASIVLQLSSGATANGTFQTYSFLNSGTLVLGSLTVQGNSILGGITPNPMYSTQINSVLRSAGTQDWNFPNLWIQRNTSNNTITKFISFGGDGDSSDDSTLADYINFSALTNANPTTSSQFRAAGLNASLQIDVPNQFIFKTNGTLALTITNGQVAQFVNSPTAPTPTLGDSSTQVATTGFVNGTPLILTNGSIATTQSAHENSMKVATTAYVDAAAHFGTWSVNSFIVGTIYHATTDGFVVAYVGNSSGTNFTLSGITDSSASPTTLVIRQVLNPAGGAVASITFPVRKGDYWQVTVANTTAGCVISWLPLGN